MKIVKNRINQKKIDKKRKKQNKKVYKMWITILFFITKKNLKYKNKKIGEKNVDKKYKNKKFQKL